LNGIGASFLKRRKQKEKFDSALEKVREKNFFQNLNSRSSDEKAIHPYFREGSPSILYLQEVVNSIPETQETVESAGSTCMFIMDAYLGPKLEKEIAFVCGP
jgi:mevalonate pyrophosphate decarboxylase